MVVMVGCNKRVREAASGEQRHGCYITLMNQNGEEVFKSANDGKRLLEKMRQEMRRDVSAAGRG